MIEKELRSMSGYLLFVIGLLMLFGGFGGIVSGGSPLTGSG
jgi:hypothetical protein